MPQLRISPPETEPGGYDLFCGSFDRDKINFDGGIGNLTFNSYVSYWANSYADGSWIGASPPFDYVNILTEPC